MDTPSASGGRISPWLGFCLAHLTGVAALDKLRRSVAPTASAAAFASAALARLGITPEFDPGELASIPRRGRMIFVANHPFGALDGLIAIAVIGAVRPDLRVFANEDLCALRELAPLLLPIEVRGRGRVTRNARSMRRALQWLEGEGALLIFPAGAVAHFDMRARCVTDPPWTRAVAMLARKSRATIVPMHLTGRNGLGFELAGFIHPALRTLLLPGELKRRKGARVPLRIGAPIEPDRLRPFVSDEGLATHLRVTTCLLARGASANSLEPAASPRPMRALAFAGAPADCAAEIARLPPACRLLDGGTNAVYCAAADDIPHLLDEIGRSREEAFRAAGGGTGRARDLDAFDAHYEHLFVWNRERQEVIGAYRLGRIDEIRKRHGRRGLYTATLFHYRDPFFRLLGPALELGRSFVVPGQQRNFAPLLLMWRGIGEYLARCPRYTRLLGSVSIGRDYRELSRQLMVEFLRSHCRDPLLARLVKPVMPVVRGRMVRTLAAEVAMLGHLDALAALLEDIEPDRKGVPVLLRHYLKLGGRMLAFNIDPKVNDAIDCLLMVDLRRTDPRVLSKYLPESGISTLSARSFPRAAARNGRRDTVAQQLL